MAQGEHCRHCGKVTGPLGETKLSARGFHYHCAAARQEQAIRQMTLKRGPVADKWREARTKGIEATAA